MKPPGATRLRSAWSCLALGLALTCSAQALHSEWDLGLVRGPDGRPLQNIYWISLPPHAQIPDAGNASATGNKCVGDPDGPVAGDGRSTASDLLCSWWTSRFDGVTTGSFTLIMIKREECTPVSYNGTYALGRIRLTGSDFALDPAQGLQVIVGVQAGSTYTPHNHAVIDGTADSAWTGVPVAFAPTCTAGQTTNCCLPKSPRMQLLACPSNTLYVSADEILCGLRGVDWDDADADGRPDTCWDDANGNGRYDAGEAPTGVFDGTHVLSVARWVNDPSSTARPGAPRRPRSAACASAASTSTSFPARLTSRGFSRAIARRRGGLPSREPRA